MAAAAVERYDSNVVSEVRNGLIKSKDRERERERWQLPWSMHQ